jgi:hypothetical protein
MSAPIAKANFEGETGMRLEIGDTPSLCHHDEIEAANRDFHSFSRDDGNLSLCPPKRSNYPRFAGFEVVVDRRRFLVAALPQTEKVLSTPARSESDHVKMAALEIYFGHDAESDFFDPSHFGCSTERSSNPTSPTRVFERKEVVVHQSPTTPKEPRFPTRTGTTRLQQIC